MRKKMYTRELGSNKWEMNVGRKLKEKTTKEYRWKYTEVVGKNWTKLKVFQDELNYWMNLMRIIFHTNFSVSNYSFLCVFLLCFDFNVIVLCFHRFRLVHNVLLSLIIFCANLFEFLLCDANYVFQFSNSILDCLVWHV